MDVMQPNCIRLSQVPGDLRGQTCHKPEWLRPRDAVRIFGLGRSKLYELIATGAIKSVSLRARGQKHGTRVISFDSLAAYLESLANK